MNTHRTEFNYRLIDLQRLFGVSRSTIYYDIQRGILPQPIKIGRTSVWLRDEIDRVIERQKAARPELTSSQ